MLKGTSKDQEGEVSKLDNKTDGGTWYITTSRVANMNKKNPFDIGMVVRKSAHIGICGDPNLITFPFGLKCYSTMIRL